MTTTSVRGYSQLSSHKTYMASTITYVLYFCSMELHIYTLVFTICVTNLLEMDAVTLFYPAKPSHTQIKIASANDFANFLDVENTPLLVKKKGKGKSKKWVRKVANWVTNIKSWIQCNVPSSYVQLGLPRNSSHSRLIRKTRNQFESAHEHTLLLIS